MVIFDFIVKTAKGFVGTLYRHIDRGVQIFIDIGNDNGLGMGDMHIKFDSYPFFLFGNHDINGCDIKMVTFKIFNSGSNMIIEMLGKFDLFGANLNSHNKSFVVDLPKNIAHLFLRGSLRDSAVKLVYVQGVIVRVLTGIQPSGDLHIGNYFGSIRAMIESQAEHEVFAFIANYHAMSSLSDGERLAKLTMQAATDFLALGMDPDKSTFWVQSDVKEVLELYWVLSGFTPMGLLERAHSYKDKVAKGIASNHSLFSYPVLMAADILLFGSQIVPVGKDQIQHVEIARDIALKFNNQYGDIFVLPEFRVDENVATVPGIDGQKMSKSYGNTIPIFSEEKIQSKIIKKIVTEAVPMEEPKEYEGCNVYNIAKLFLDYEECAALQERYKRGGEGHGHFKLYTHDVIWEYFRPYRERRAYFESHQDEVRDILNAGAAKARAAAQPIIEKVRSVTGIRY